MTKSKSGVQRRPQVGRGVRELLLKRQDKVRSKWTSSKPRFVSSVEQWKRRRVPSGGTRTSILGRKDRSCGPTFTLPDLHSGATPTVSRPEQRSDNSTAPLGCDVSNFVRSRCTCPATRKTPSLPTDRTVESVISIRLGGGPLPGAPMAMRRPKSIVEFRTIADSFVPTSETITSSPSPPTIRVFWILTTASEPSSFDKVQVPRDKVHTGNCQYRTPPERNSARHVDCALGVRYLKIVINSERAIGSYT